MHESNGRAFPTLAAHLAFDAWLEATDEACWAKWGVSIHDLPDLDHYAMWEGGVSPSRAADRTVAYAEGMDGDF